MVGNRYFVRVFNNSNVHSYISIREDCRSDKRRSYSSSFFGYFSLVSIVACFVDIHNLNFSDDSEKETKSVAAEETENPEKNPTPTTEEIPANES